MQDSEALVVPASARGCTVQSPTAPLERQNVQPSSSRFKVEVQLPVRAVKQNAEVWTEGFKVGPAFTED